MIRVSSLSGGYGGRMIVEDVSFTAGKGEFVGILGPNGSGKNNADEIADGNALSVKGRGARRRQARGQIQAAGACENYGRFAAAYGASFYIYR